MDEVIHLTTPFDIGEIESLRSGVRVTISGVLYTARDAAHSRLLELIEAGEELPIPIEGQVIYYVGPSPAPPGKVIGAAGPTTSYRMDPYTPRLLELGLKGMIGKGRRSREVREAIVKHKALYMAAIGGAGALMARAVKESRVVAYEDLGPEAIRELKVEKLPAIVVNDTVGNDLYQREPENTALSHPPLRAQDPRDIRQKELNTILRFSALTNSSLNIEDVLNYAMQWAEEFMDAEASTVYELDEQMGELFVRIARGEKKDPAKRIKLRVGEGVAGHVVQSGQPMVVQDVRKEKCFSDKFDRMTGFTTRSMICVPLVFRGKLFGALQVLNKKSGKPFTYADLELLTSMSQQIAVALENAKLYRRLEERFELTAQELRETQENFIRSERLEAMSHLVQGVAHEIRNPITTIGGFAWRIKKAFKENSKLQSYIGIILDESQRLENLVRRVRELGNALSATLTLDDITPVIELVVDRFNPIARKQNVDLVPKIDKKLRFIKMDSSQLVAALSNIIENALESMPHGGKLALEAKQEPDHVLIRITDTGWGISEKDLDSVYDPFFTSKTKSAGLGLTMVHQIVMNHDGEIKTQSKKGKGTTVTIRFPSKR